MPRARSPSRTPTVTVDSRPTAAPSSDADGTSSLLTRRASSSGTSLSKLCREASIATTASRRRPRKAASRTCCTPTTAVRARTPKPTSLSSFRYSCSFRVSYPRLIPAPCHHDRPLHQLRHLPRSWSLTAPLLQPHPLQHPDCPLLRSEVRRVG